MRAHYKKMELADMLARTIFVPLMLINGFEFINADGDSFSRLENIAFDLQTQIQHLSDQLNAQNIKMQNMEATIGQQNEKIEALNKYCEMKDWLKIKNENDRVENVNLTLKRDSTPDNLDPSLTPGLHRKKRDLEPRVSRQKRLILGKLLKEFFSEKDICIIHGFAATVRQRGIAMDGHFKIR